MDDTIGQASHRFREYLQRRQYAAHTIASYTLDLQLFFATCHQPLTQVTFREVEQFLEQQYQQALAPTTIHRRLHALKHFFDYLVAQRRVMGNPVKPSHMVRRGRPLPIAFTVALLHAGDGGIQAIAAIVRDETARWEEERALRRRLTELEVRSR